MQKRSGFIVTFILFFLSVQAQQSMSFPEVDKTSYDLYIKGNWEELIQFAEEARRQGIDFFYLQARTGIALYNLKKYRKAAKWFTKAWENDRSFEWLQEYTYYSLLFGGQTSEAYKKAASFSPGLQEKISYTSSKIMNIAIEAGYSFNPRFESLKTEPHGVEAGVGDNYGEAFYLKNYHFESFDLSHRIAPSVSVNHNLTYVGITREQIVDWVGRNSFSSNTNQFQYFLNPTLLLGRKLNFSPSISIIWGDNSYSSGGFRGNQRYFSQSRLNYHDWVFSVSAWTHFENFSPGAEYNYADISELNFSQYSVWLTFYPLSNLNLYLTPRFYFKDDKAKGFAFNTMGISGGFQAGSVHFYGQYLNGDMVNFIEPAGYVVSNFPGTSEHKFTGSLYFPTGKKYRFVLRYITQDVAETYQVYSNYFKSNSVSYSYVKHSLTAGISWSF